MHVAMPGPVAATWRTTQLYGWFLSSEDSIYVLKLDGFNGEK